MYLKQDTVKAFPTTRPPSPRPTQPRTSGGCSSGGWAISAGQCGKVHPAAGPFRPGSAEKCLSIERQLLCPTGQSNCRQTGGIRWISIKCKKQDLNPIAPSIAPDPIAPFPLLTRSFQWPSWLTRSSMSTRSTSASRRRHGTEPIFVPDSICEICDFPTPAASASACCVRPR